MASQSEEETAAPAPDTARGGGPWQERALALVRQPRFSRALALLLALAALASGVGTYLALTGVPPFGDDPQTLTLLIYLDGFLLLLLAGIVILRLVAIWSARRRGSAGSRIHVRLVWFFGLLAVAPATLVAVFSVLFFDLGLESWFSERVRTAVQESNAVAEAYLEEHQRNIRVDALRIARDLARDAPFYDANPALLQRALLVQTSVRGITEAIVFEHNGPVLARAGLTLALEFERVDAEARRAADQGDVVLLPGDELDRVRALVRLENFLNHYLLVGRSVDPEVLARLAKVRGAAEQFEALEGERADIQVSFALAFIVVTLLLLMAAIWVGLNFATQLTEPISGLIAATEQVRAGDLAVQVPEAKSGDEIGLLSRAFNRMTAQLARQREELLEAARQIDERRRFGETVLAGVSSGVIALDADGRLNLSNRTASQLLGVDLEELAGYDLAEIVPELGDVLHRARNAEGAAPVQEQLEIATPAGTRTLLVRIGTERGREGVFGYVLTFDDLTELQNAQRKAAWADVARRIAHEIKNPLTPIQLSAERLKRKYLKEIRSDPQVFEGCVETIIRQVDDIGRMVDEFSSFARMPAPVMREENLTELVKQAVFLQRNAYKDVTFDLAGADEAHPIEGDGHQISQALTNILQNAHDAIMGRDGADLPPGRISVTIGGSDGSVRVAVRDNGRGLPADERDRLTEPYVTTRAKGTGLGLAIVKKIMEDHGGGLSLSDAPGGGAEVVLSFPAAGRARAA